MPAQLRSIAGRSSGYRLFLNRARRDPEGTFRLVQRMHWVLLAASLGTVFGAAAGSHGWLLSLYRIDADQIGVGSFVL